MAFGDPSLRLSRERKVWDSGRTQATKTWRGDGAQRYRQWSPRIQLDKECPFQSHITCKSAGDLESMIHSRPVDSLSR